MPRGCVLGVTYYEPMSFRLQTVTINMADLEVRNILSSISILKFIILFMLRFYIFTQYLSGFGYEFSSEALKNALPKGQVCKFYCYDCAISHVE